MVNSRESWGTENLRKQTRCCLTSKRRWKRGSCWTTGKKLGLELSLYGSKVMARIWGWERKESSQEENVCTQNTKGLRTETGHAIIQKLGSEPMQRSLSGKMTARAWQPGKEILQGRVTGTVDQQLTLGAGTAVSTCDLECCLPGVVEIKAWWGWIQEQSLGKE